MSLFKSGNPTLSEKKFNDTVIPGHVHTGETMTVKGTLNKFGFLFLMLMGTSYYSWKEFNEGGEVFPLILIGAIGGLVVALILAFKRDWSPFLARSRVTPPPVLPLVSMCPKIP
ncbi:MAG: hypothetical protein FGM46_07630 [Ferruginibacter sp.]|nr:hypothetical protein [Ferruginibacter sp.]